MSGHFITDVRLEDSNEVLHIPVLKGKAVKKLLSGIAPKNILLGEVNAPCADDPLEQFLQHAGCLFGKDPSKWEQVGEPIVDVSEEGGKRRIKKTGTYSGTQLHLWHEPAYHDSRLPVLADQPHLNFNVQRAEVTTTEEWQALIADQPWTAARRRQLALRYLHAKLAAPGEQLQLEGGQGLLELSINKEHHVDLMDADALRMLVTRLRSSNVEVAKTCAAAVWGLATSAEARHLLLQLGVMDALAAVAKGSLALVVATGVAGDPRGGDVNGMFLEEGYCTEKQREELQANVLGALAVFLVDRSCRQPYIQLEPDWSTLFAMAGWLPGYSKPWATARREAAAKVLSSAMQRDGEARTRLIESGALEAVLALLDQQGPEASLVVQFCMSSLLAVLVLDDDAMEMVRERGEAPLMFRSCLQLTMRAMGAIKQHYAAPPPSARGLMSESGVYVAPSGAAGEGGVPAWEPASAVQMAEAAAQAMWGATHYCLQDDLEVTQEDAVDLGKLGLDCIIIGEVDLGCVCHCVAATLAALSADERCAAYIMSAPGGSVIRTVLALVEVEDDPGFSHSGSVRAAACTCLSFLSCHPLGASGDECLNGPFRTQLLQSGAFGALLRAALASNEGDDCDDVIQQTASVGIMYLATMAGAVDAAELAMYAALMSSNTNVEMVEYLMAGMWILLKNPDNRKVLGGAFAVNPASSKLAASLADKLQDTIEVADVHEEAMKIARMQNKGAHAEKSTAAPPAESSNQPIASATGKAGAPSSTQVQECTPSTSRQASRHSNSMEAAGTSGLAREVSDRGSLHEEASSMSGARLAPAKSIVPDLPLGSVEEGFGYLAAHTETLEDKLKAVEHKRKSILYNHLQQQQQSTGQAGAPLTAHASEAQLSGGSSSASRQLLSLQSIRTMKGVDDRVEKSLANIESSLGEELEDNWGLDTLVRVGETWLERLMELQGPQEATDAAPDLPLLKLFEFLTASMCLYVIDEDGAGLPRREADMYTRGTPKGATSGGWWTIAAPLPTPEPMVNPLLQRTITILLTVLRIKVPSAWKSMQLSVVMLWNAAAKSSSVERHEVDQGILDALLDITHCSLWPPTLRDMASGQLQFLMETYANLKYLSVTESCAAACSPGAIDAATDGSAMSFSNTPHPGLVPFLHAMVCLVATAHPLLELRGARGIARTCYAAPAGATNTSALLAEAKSIAAALGALGVLVGLLKRSAARYLTLYAGGTPPPPPALSVLAEDTYKLYTRDLSQLEGVLEVFGATTAALLNLSVLKANQPRLARVGLLTLLSTNTCLYEAISAKADGALVEEARLLDTMAAIIQNLANHPDNRTRLYKAELRGTAALDKLIEGPASPEPSDLPASLASPVSGTHARNNRSLTSSPVPGGTRAGMQSPGRTGSPRAAAATAAAAAAAPAAAAAAAATIRSSPRKGHIIGTAILSGTPDPAMVASASLRPKAAFAPPAGAMSAALATHPPACQPTTSGRHADERAQSPGLQGYSSGMPPMSPGYGKNGRGGSAGMGGPGSMDSRDEFLLWLDSTFLGDDDGKQPDSPNGRSRRAARRAAAGAVAGLVDTEADPCRPGLQRLLCRPLHHLWQDTPEARARAGKSRWEPPVSEYREGKGAYAVHRNAAKLLQTAAPGEAGSLMAATMQLGNGRLQMDTATIDRPSTANRSQGRTAMTVLQPREDLIPARLMASINHSMEQQQQHEQQQEQAQQHPDSNLRVTFGGSSNVGDALDLALADVMEAMGQEQDDMPIVSLKVAMAPQRPRTVISFEDKLFPDAAPGHKAILTIFEHVEGARVSDGLFSEYTLPNGRKAFMYYQGGDVMDEAAMGPVMPPARPTTVPLALQQSMPLGKVLGTIAKPPGTAPPFKAAKPVPRLVPLPPRHTLAVKRPDMLDAGAFGNLREDHLQLVLSAEQILKQQTTTYEEDISIIPQEEREPWTLPMSVFKPRAKEADAKAYHDNAGSLDKVFERDWQRATAKEKFTSMLGREAKASGNGKSERQALEEIHEVLKKHYQAFLSAFTYYASLGGNDPYHMPLNAFTSFLDDCNIPDSESQAIKRSDCDTIFIVCNFQPDKKSAEAAVNDEHALMRYEFMEVFVRAGIAKYIKGGSTDDLANAIDMLFSINILPGVPYAASIVPNDFRNERLYTEEVDLVLKKHQLLLRALYSRYRLKPSGGGLRPKVLRLDGWLQLLNDAHIVDSQFTLQDATLSFLWSRMVVVDEIKDYARYTSLTFIDFMEALGRVADMKTLPTASDLADSGFPSIMEWALEKERYEGGGGGGVDGGADSSSMPEIFRPRASCRLDAPKPRPLYAKLELLIELICRRLHWDPAQPEAPYSMDALLRMVKQIDKNLGP